MAAAALAAAACAPPESRTAARDGAVSRPGKAGSRSRSGPGCPAAALSHRGVRQARIGHGVRQRARPRRRRRAIVPGRFAAISRAVRWHHHPGRGWRRFDAGFASASGAGFGAVALPDDPSLEGPGDPPLAFGPGGPVLDDGIAAVTTRTGVAYATEDVPGSIRRTHELGHPRPYFPRRRGHY